MEGAAARWVYIGKKGDRMNRKIRILVAGLMLAGGTCLALPQGKAPAPATEEERAALFTQEQVGDLRIGMSQADAAKAVPCRVQRGKEVFEAATGDYVQDWRYPPCGLTFKMGSGTKGGPKTVQSITVTGPSTLQTKRGIRIGSTEQEVVQAYGRYRDEEWSKKGESFVAGSVYGGLIFTFTGGKVSKIFLGAAAE
jgi:hypothetical protein